MRHLRTPRLSTVGLAAAALTTASLIGCAGQPNTQSVQSTSTAASAPSGAVPLGPADQKTELTVQFHLAQQVAGADIAQLVELAAADATSAPMAAQDVAATTGATVAVGDAVTTYFASSGLTATIDPTRTFASVKLNVGQATKLLSTSFTSYREIRGRCASAKPARAAAADCDFVAPAPNATVTVPAELEANLHPGPVTSQVAGLNTRPLFARTARATTQTSMYDASDPKSSPWWSRSGTGTPCQQAAGDPGFLISQLRTAYGFPAGKPGSGPFKKQNVVFVGLSGEDGASQQMLTSLANCAGIAAADQPKLTLVPHKGSTPTTNGSEANGDAQTLAAFGAPAIGTIYEVNDGVGPTPAGFLQTLSDATTFNDPVTKDPVDVVSISYAACEPQVQEGFGFSIDMGEQVLAKAAMARRTVVAASGDSGSSACVSNGVGPTELAVNYPASSQWVTAVGGARLYLDDHNKIQDTEVWNDSYLYAGSPKNSQGQVDSGSPGAGGGGVSTVVARPSWQTGTGVVLTDKRQLPDVSYFADPYPGAITNYLGWGTFSGTSMAAPMFAAAVAQYNARNPGAHLGFVNPKLYAAINSGKIKPHDITKGSNILGGHDSTGTYDPAPSRSCCQAQIGFDTASGWGSVDVQSMIDGIPAGGG